jgi:hypothetical protein
MQSRWVASTFGFQSITFVPYNLELSNLAMLYTYVRKEILLILGSNWWVKDKVTMTHIYIGQGHCDPYIGQSQGHYDPVSTIGFRTIHVSWEPPYVLWSPIFAMWYSYGRGRTLFFGSIGQMSRSQWRGVYSCFPNFK